jgi:hypothetical protein
VLFRAATPVAEETEVAVLDLEECGLSVPITARKYLGIISRLSRVVGFVATLFAKGPRPVWRIVFRIGEHHSNSPGSRRVETTTELRSF